MSDITTPLQSSGPSRTVALARPPLGYKMSQTLCMVLNAAEHAVRSADLNIRMEIHRYVNKASVG